MVNKGALVESVIHGSLADKNNISCGEYIRSINGTVLRDMIDYQMAVADEHLDVEVSDSMGNSRIINICKDYDDDLGLLFNKAVFDGMSVCRNKCLFCFVDQMPKGHRKTLYVKDDDYRMSFLYGNYITLTNLTEEDFKRIITEHISPLYISIHAINQEVRNKLIGINEEIPIIDKLKRLVDNGISMHGQVVLVPGINDGEVLEETIREVVNLASGFESLAIVPVGLTKYQKYKELRLNTVDEANDVINIIHKWQNKCMEKLDTRFVFASDELYIQGDCDIPSDEEYEFYPQIENGVGLIRVFWEDYQYEKTYLPKSLKDNTKVYIITGIDGEKALSPIVADLNNIDKLDVSTLAVNNKFFGSTVSVTGLLTGNDIIDKINENFDNKAIYLLPSILLKHGEDKLLDDITVQDIISKCGVDLRVIDTTANDIVEFIISLERN